MRDKLVSLTGRQGGGGRGSDRALVRLGTPTTDNLALSGIIRSEFAHQHHLEAYMR